MFIYILGSKLSIPFGLQLLSLVMSNESIADVYIKHNTPPRCLNAGAIAFMVVLLYSKELVIRCSVNDIAYRSSVCATKEGGCYDGNTR